MQRKHTQRYTSNMLHSNGRLGISTGTRQICTYTGESEVITSLYKGGLVGRLINHRKLITAQGTEH